MNETSSIVALPLVESDEERAIRDAVRTCALRYGHDRFIDAARRGESPTELWDSLAAGGYLGVNIPEAYGGGGLGLRELCMVSEELAAAGCPLLLLLVSPAIAGTILTRHGSPIQRERWLPGIGAGTSKIVFAITEADAGSNTHRIATTARRDGEDWVLNGAKTFISGVNEADAVLVVARSGASAPGAPGQLSLFLVDAGAPGLQRTVIPTALDAPELQFTLFFDNVRVPGDRLVGAEGDGLRIGFDGLNPERLIAASICTGTGRYALERACTYARERQVWSAPIGSHQGIAHPLAEAKMALELARHTMQRAAALHDAGLPAGEACNMAKFAAAEAGMKCVDQAIQTHGGNGIALEYGLTSLWWTVRLMAIAPVSREMILNYVAEHSLGLPRSY
nr:acyl-CoA dehydrogenase family protein [Sporichthya sp.]